MKYRHIQQLDEWGCGVACAASLLGISYAAAKSLLVSIKGKPIDSRPYGLSLRALSKAIPTHKAHFNIAEKANRWPVGTIVFLSEETGRYAGSGHYLLRTPQGWMDPLANSQWHVREPQFRKRLPAITSVHAALVPGAG